MKKNVNEILSEIKNKIDSHEQPNYHELPYELITNKEFVLKVLKIETAAPHKVPGSIYNQLSSTFFYPELYCLLTDSDIINEAIKIPYNVKDVPEEYVTFDIAKMIADSPCFHLLPKKWQTDSEIFDIFVNFLNKKDFFAIETCDKEIISKAFISLAKLDFDFTTDANTRYALIRIIPYLNKEAMKYLVKINPYYIEKSSFKDDEEIVLEGIKVNGGAFEVASKRLRSDITFIQKALQIEVDSWLGISDELTENPALIALRDEMLIKQNKKVTPWGWS